jgi:predicted metalloprotease
MGAAVAGTILSGCGTIGGEQLNEVTAAADGVSTNATPEQRQVFSEIDNYWGQTRGLGKTGIKLVAIGEGQKFTCTETDVTITTDVSPAAYCHDSNTISISLSTWKDLEQSYVHQGGRPEDYTKLVLGHEYGHGVQQFLSKRRGYDINVGLTQIDIENQADCLDGEAMSTLQPDAVIEPFFNLIGDDYSNPNMSHGTAPQRIAAYEGGQNVSGGVLTGCGLEYSELDPRTYTMTPGI